MDLENTIAISLIGARYKMRKEWKLLIEVPLEIESELTVLACKAQTNTGDDFDYLFRHRKRFCEADMLQAMPGRIREEVCRFMISDLKFGPVSGNRQKQFVMILS